MLLSLSNLSSKRYRYTEDLQALERASEGVQPPPFLHVKSPLILSAWEEGLASFPDRAFASLLTRGIAQGFRIGVPTSFTGRLAPRNLQSAYDHKEVVEDYLDREEFLGRIQRITPEEQSSLKRRQISPFGVIPKRHKPDKWRLIVNLSSPEGRSVNDAISEEQCSISYASLDDAIAFLRELGPGALLAKLDLKEAYRAVPVHPSDQDLLAVHWQGITYVDRALPFGLRSAPKIFSSLINGFMWLLHGVGVQRALHYLDDFLLLGPANSLECQKALTVTLDMCKRVGLPVATEKTEGPSTCLIFLGIEIDTVAHQLYLPEEKVERLQSIIAK